MQRLTCLARSLPCSQDGKSAAVITKSEEEIAREAKQTAKHVEERVVEAVKVTCARLPLPVSFLVAQVRVVGRGCSI